MENISGENPFMHINAGKTGVKGKWKNVCKKIPFLQVKKKTFMLGLPDERGNVQTKKKKKV